MTLLELLNDPNRLTLTVDEAAKILGVSRVTAFHAAANTGQLIDGVPVIRVTTGSGRERLIVSVAHLRKALGMETQ